MSKPKNETEPIRLLAQADALFEPIRNWSDGQHVAGVIERREQYKKRGLPYLVGGTDAERQAAVRLADRLEQSGEVVFSRTKGKRSHWRLSDAGDWQWRWNCLLTWKSELATAMMAIQVNAAAGHAYNGGTFVPELALAGSAGEKGRLLNDVAEMLAPGLLRGWVNSASDCNGLVFYCVTKSGDQVLTQWSKRCPKPPTDAYNSRTSRRRADVYLRELQAARRALSFARGASNHCVIPLSAGCYPATPPACPPVVSADGEPLTYTEWCHA